MPTQHFSSILHGLLDSLPAATCAVSLPEGRILYANLRAHDLLRMEDSALLEQRLQSLFIDPAKARRLLEEAAQGRSTAETFAEVRRSDGVALSLSLSMHPATLDGHSMCFIHAAWGDSQFGGFTGSKGFPGNDPESLYRLLAENMGDVVWWMDLSDRRLLYVSPSVYRLRGYTPGERLGESVNSSLTPESRAAIDERTVERIEEFKRTGTLARPYVDVLEMYRKDGSTIWVEVTSNFVFGISGHIEVVGLTRDITERRRLEMAEAHTRAELEFSNAQLLRANNELERLAITDALTGVWNRRRFTEAAQNEVARFVRYGQATSLILFDLDNFKNVNDRFGHQIGDAVLMDVARLARENIRDTDSLSRWGGEEFAILAPNTTLNQAWAIAEKLRQQFSAHAFTGECSITASFGIAQLSSVADVDQWLKRADDALFLAKAEGRNRVKTWEELAR